MVKKTYDEKIGEIPINFTLALGPDSISVFKLGSDVEKYSGLNVAEGRQYNDSPDDAYIYGLCNVMNGGKDIYFYVNASRLKGAITEEGEKRAMYDLLFHESIHVAYLCIAKWKGKGATNWVNLKWPVVGESGDITEEQFARVVGFIGQTIADDFSKMYKKVSND